MATHSGETPSRLLVVGTAHSSALLPIRSQARPASHARNNIGADRATFLVHCTAIGSVSSVEIRIFLPPLQAATDACTTDTISPLNRLRPSTPVTLGFPESDPHRSSVSSCAYSSK